MVESLGVLTLFSGFPVISLVVEQIVLLVESESRHRLHRLVSSRTGLYLPVWAAKLGEAAELRI